METLQAAPGAVEMEVGRPQAGGRLRLAQLRDPMNTVEAHRMLDRLIDGPIRCTPDSKRYQLDAAFARGTPVQIWITSPAGFEPA